MIPFYQPENAQPNFKHNSTNRKSFSRGTQKFRISLGGAKPAKVEEEQEDNKSQTYDEQSSPNLSLEVVNEAALEHIESTSMSSLHNLPYSYGIDMGSSRVLNVYGPSSLHVPEGYSIYSVEKGETANDVEYSPNDSNPPILNNYDNCEMAEDFPVNQNYTASNYKTVPASTINASSKSIKKTTTTLHKRNTAMSNTKQTSTAIFGSNKLGQASSVSSMELHKLDDNMVLKKSTSTTVVNKNKRTMMGSQSQFYKENAQQKNISVEIITKPPMRSRTTLDMRTTANQTKVQEKHTHVRIELLEYEDDLISETVVK